MGIRGSGCLGAATPGVYNTSIIIGVEGAMTDDGYQDKKGSHTFLPLEILRWALVAVVPYLAACYLVGLTNTIIGSMRSMTGMRDAPWLDAVIVDIFSTSFFILLGIALAPRLKFPVAILMCLAALYVHFDQSGVHSFMTDTVLGALPASFKNMLPAAQPFCSDSQFMFGGVIVVGGIICLAQWKLEQARAISENAYRESINTLYDPNQQ